LKRFGVVKASTSAVWFFFAQVQANGIDLDDLVAHSQAIEDQVFASHRGGVVELDATDFSRMGVQQAQRQGGGGQHGEGEAFHGWSPLVGAVNGGEKLGGFSRLARLAMSLRA
jgi:hypothetical protein